jgi:hypothetical protein
MIGEVWKCPHCSEPILRSVATCPACRRHLRFGAVNGARASRASVCPLTVDGRIQHPANEPAREYSVVVEINDERGDMVTRRVVGVGALRPGESRTFTLRVEVLAPEPSTVAVES